MIPHFDRIISIELGEDLYRNAVRKFAHEPKVQLIRGDSAIRMDEVVQGLDGNVVFWLDGHYSEGITARGDQDCPIIEELHSIIVRRCVYEYEGLFVILIDDARLFDGDKWPGLSNVVEMVNDDFDLENDIIRIIL